MRTLHHFRVQSDADKVRALLAQLGLSQRAAARLLEVQERAFRQMCAGTRDVPRTVMLALERLNDTGDT